jgi:regulator of sigma E protease
MSWFLAFAGFAALIVLHEFGHFVAAKAVGMRVERFSLFFGPMLVKFRRGETEYGIGPIPLGGYVRITGMSPHEDLPPEVARRAYLRQPVWKRIVVIAAGPAVNVLIAFVVLFTLFLTQGAYERDNTIAAVERGQPAAGLLRPGDKLVAVDGQPGDRLVSPAGEPGDPEELSRRIQAHPCAGRPVAGCPARTPAVLTVERDGRLVTFPVTPRYDARADPPRMRVGFAFQTRSRDVGLGEAAGTSIDAMWRVTTATVEAITRLFYDERARREVSGVVGSYEATRQSFEFDTVQALNVLAIISLSLAIVNLFPFLPLDGGHIFWALAEKVRRRPIPFSVMERAGVVGFLLVIALFAIGLSNDIGRLRGEGFGVR